MGRIHGRLRLGSGGHAPARCGVNRRVRTTAITQEVSGRKSNRPDETTRPACCRKKTVTATGATPPAEDEQTTQQCRNHCQHLSTRARRSRFRGRISRAWHGGRRFPRRACRLRSCGVGRSALDTAIPWGRRVLFLTLSREFVRRQASPQLVVIGIDSILTAHRFTSDPLRCESGGEPRHHRDRRAARDSR